MIADRNADAIPFRVDSIIDLLSKPKLSFQLGQNYPNPFNPETWIPYQLANDQNVKINIYNVNGELVRTLEIGWKSEGTYLDQSRAAHWDGKNRYGEKVASGIYFYELSAGDHRATRKMIILK